MVPRGFVLFLTCGSQPTYEGLKLLFMGASVEGYSRSQPTYEGLKLDFGCG